MVLTREQRAVLNVFKAHKLRRGNYLARQTFDQERAGLPKKVQKNRDSIIKDLIDSGYVIADPLGYGLTEKGYAQIQEAEASMT